MHTTDSRFMTVPEFATYFRVARSTVYRAIRDREIRSVTVGDAIRIPGTEVDRLMREGGVSA